MKKIVIIGANDFQNQLILKAKEMGFETHVFAWQDGSIGEHTADYFYPVSIVDNYIEVSGNRVREYIGFKYALFPSMYMLNITFMF